MISSLLKWCVRVRIIVITLAILALVVPAWAQAGTFVYVANEFDNNVSGYSIDPATGVLTPVSGSPFAAGTQPRSCGSTGSLCLRGELRLGV